MVAIFYKNEKYTDYYVFLDQQKLESIIWFGNVAKRLRSFSFSTPPFFERWARPWGVETGNPKNGGGGGRRPKNGGRKMDDPKNEGDGDGWPQKWRGGNARRKEVLNFTHDPQLKLFVCTFPN